MRESSYSAVLATLLEELASLQVFLLSRKVESDALVVLLRRLRTWLTHTAAVMHFDIQLTEPLLRVPCEENH